MRCRGELGRAAEKRNFGGIATTFACGLGAVFEEVRDTIVWTDRGRAWVRNLSRDPRVAFTAQQAQPPYGAVIMRGDADISAPGADVDGDIRRIAGRYLPEGECDAYIAAWPQLRTVVRVHPATIQAWGRGC